MTREQALKALLSDAAHSRLRAARFLARNNNETDIQVLRNALQRETVSYVRRGLELAIKRASRSLSNSESKIIKEYQIPDDIREQIKNEVMEQISGQILHEIASPVGLIAAAAAREVPVYEHSKTKRHVENLKRIFEAIEQLKGAAAVPKPEEFDLAELVDDIVSVEVGESLVEVSKHGAKPMIINSDRALVRLAVSNGIRNAIESVSDTSYSEPCPIVVTWGETDIDYWVAVLDYGPGLAGPTESAFGIGKTTKKGHSGFGLTIARQAIETLGGYCILQPAKEGGTRFEVRWEQ